MEYRKTRTLSQLTLGKRLALCIMAIISIATLVVGIYGSTLTEHFLRERFKDRMMFLAKYLALNSELGILIGDHRMLQKLAENLMSEKDLKGVKIIDSKGEVLVVAGSFEEGTMNLASWPVKLRSEDEELIFSMGNYNNVTQIGTVFLYYSEKSIEELVRRFKDKIFLMTIFVVGVAVVLTILISRTLTAPLKTLSQAAKEVARGRMDIRVSGGSLPETRELAIAFNNMLVALEESRNTLEATYQEMIQQKAMAEVGEFAFTVAHEIKNPLGIIQGALEILKKPEASLDTKETMIEYLEDEVRRLNRIIQDFLEFSRPRDPNFVKTDLTLLVKDVVQKVKLEWEPKGIEFMISQDERPCSGRIDPELISQVLLNLVKNACEACENVEIPKVSIETRLRGDTFKIKIKDNGHGIPEELIEKIFDPFFTTKSKGTGLGLALVKRVIELHGGTINVESNQGEGAMFIITLPASGG